MTADAPVTITPFAFANYPGDVGDDAVGRIMGPNNLGELLMAVSAEYTAETDSTRVGFKIAPFPRQPDPDVWPKRKKHQPVHPDLLTTPSKEFRRG